MLQVIVKNVAGRLLEGEFNEKSTITDLKAWVHDQWQVPPQCQEIVSDSSVLPDSSVLDDCTQEIDGSRLFTAIVSLERVCADLQCTDAPKQLAALVAIAELGSLVGEVVIDSLILLVQDREISSSVRAEAVSTLSHVAGRRSEDVILAVSECLFDMLVQQAAIQALRDFARQGKQRSVIVAVFQQIQQMQHPPSRHFHGESTVFDMEFPDCNDDDDGVPGRKEEARLWLLNMQDAVMIQALSAASDQAEMLDDQVTRACCAHLKHKSAHVRRISIEALASNKSVLDDSALVDALVGRLSDPALSVKAAVLKILLTSPLQVRQKVIAALTSLVHDPSDCIRSSALDILGAMVDKGSLVDSGAVSGFLVDPNWFIRQSAVQILGVMAEKGSRFEYTDVVGNLRWWNFPQVTKVLADWQSSSTLTHTSL